MKSASRKPQPKRKCFKSRGFSRLFCFSWEQRKAKELFVSTADKGYPELPVLSATQDRGMIRRDENSINIFHDKKNEAGYKRVLPGQFVIHLRSFQGGFAHSAIEGITSPAYTVFGFSEPEKHDSEYWKYVFTSKSFIRRLETVTYGIRDGRSISYEEFLTLGFVYPSKAEQTAIARYLDKLSDLITLHQRDSIMRFFGAWDNANAWEQRKFEDLYDYASEGGTPDTNNPAFYEGGKIPFVKIEDTVEKYIDSPKSYITEEGMNHSSAWLIPKGNVIFTNGATVGNVAINRLPVTTKQGILGIIPSKKVTSEFLFYLLSSTEFQREVRSRMATGTFATIILKSLNEIPVCFPSNTNEQESIITILSRLDNLITLHQRERKNRLFGGKNVKQYNFSRLVLQLLRAMDSRLQRRGSSQGDYG